MGLNKSKVIHYAFWFWFILVTILSVIPRIPGSRVAAWGLEFRIDYLEHLVVYFILGALFVSSKRKVVNDKTIIKGLYILVWMIFAIITELVQKFVAGRSFNPNDMYYNVVGIILGMAITMTYYRKLKHA